MIFVYIVRSKYSFPFRHQSQNDIWQYLNQFAYSQSWKFPSCLYLMTIVIHADILKREFLLITCCWGKQCNFYSSFEPGRSNITGIADFLNALNFVTNTLCLTVTKGNHADKFLVFAYIICIWNLAVRETNPTGVQSQCLSIENKLLSIIAHSFVEVFGLFTYHHDIVLNSAELTIRQQPLRKLLS